MIINRAFVIFRRVDSCLTSCAVPRYKLSFLMTSGAMPKALYGNLWLPKLNPYYTGNKVFVCVQKTHPTTVEFWILTFLFYMRGLIYSNKININFRGGYKMSTTAFSNDPFGTLYFKNAGLFTSGAQPDARWWKLLAREQLIDIFSALLTKIGEIGHNKMRIRMPTRLVGYMWYQKHHGMSCGPFWTLWSRQWTTWNFTAWGNKT